MEIWSDTSPTADAVPPLPLESVKGSLRSHGGSKPPPYDVESIPCEDKSPHAQASSVPMRRAGRRARDEAWALPHALGGEKSPIGGIGTLSVAPHLNRQFLREVRSEFSLSVIGAAGRSSGTLVCFFWNFSFKQRKVSKTPFWEGKWRLCVSGSTCRNADRRGRRSLRCEINSVRGWFCRTR